MRTQQAAEREEQQRIKNLVLNYDLRDAEAEGYDGKDKNPFLLTRNPNHRRTETATAPVVLRKFSMQERSSSSSVANLGLRSQQPLRSISLMSQNQNLPSAADKNIVTQSGADSRPLQSPYMTPRFDKASNSRSTQRARKLQLSDVDW